MWRSGGDSGTRNIRKFHRSGRTLQDAATSERTTCSNVVCVKLVVLVASASPPSGLFLLFHTLKEKCMSKLAYTAAFVAVLSLPALADTMSNAQMMRQMPSNSVTVTDWYKQNVYDSKDNKIGEVMDVLLDKSGKVTSLIVGVGGFLGVDEKDVAVPFDAVQVTNKNNNKWYLVMNTTKSDLKSAPGFKYDRDSTTWVPDNK
jgi:sporulation protein YlmC with PRC-barrel domain